jgi:hypothetical protein
MSESNSALPPIGASDGEALPRFSSLASPASICGASKVHSDKDSLSLSLHYSTYDFDWKFADPYPSRRSVLFRNVVAHDGATFEVRWVLTRTFSYYGDRAVCISRNVASLGIGCFFRCGALQTVVFEAGSHLREIEQDAFEGCGSLRSIAIPFFVGRLGANCFSVCDSLQSVTFERPSSLAAIDRYAFSNCHSLTWLSIPAWVSEIHEGAFYDSGIRSIAIEDGSVSFGVVKEFLVDFEVRSLVWVIGSLESIRIPSSIEELRPLCCSRKAGLRTVEFESDSNLRSIGRYAFAYSYSLESICIPSSLEVLPDSCFWCCSSLRTVTFETDSRLRLIERDALGLCPSLESVAVPSSVEVIGTQPVTFVSRP